ncbi:MAG: enoyl-CoA hydratase/isomerase family protein [Deltaproteobacteria bacterium]|nr:enoyl-CoA hydratase/isomerase family protein [Deltaproteobacteria bacterium]MBW1922304.1 enoyl-CoA hydratase/isomerase family protein [Deltaproteobacteria bacterium]MBW1949114.1 enoyl-CoA hydratase/isomerase family protein [Deltaproteobacteria bacterium]MBW2008586.1 enoyl-CoA hydratase/isomerase family protein [Deltaproteobacteria bacterium]MBW2101274.1 enoyl-CoA hydratase/isomerase family protein [Deltaproteobacteria bacterium]
MTFEQIEYRPGKVARIILNRPRYLNAQGYGLLEEMDAAFKLAEEDQQCGAVVLSGAGRAFSAGHDIGTQEEKDYRDRHGLSLQRGPDRYRKFRDMRRYYLEKTLSWRNFPKPTVAMVHGYCIFGGWMIAAAMDVIFAARDSLFLPGMVEYFSIPWDLGPRKAKEILLEHRFITAVEALRYGFVNRLYPREELETETLAYAERVAENYLSFPFWTSIAKSSINRMQDTMGFSSEMDAGFNDFCLAMGLKAEDFTPPGEGGFARTHIAKKNFERSKPWLKRERLLEEES